VAPSSPARRSDGGHDGGQDVGQLRPRARRGGRRSPPLRALPGGGTGGQLFELALDPPKSRRPRSCSAARGATRATCISRSWRADRTTRRGAPRLRADRRGPRRRRRVPRLRGPARLPHLRRAGRPGDARSDAVSCELRVGLGAVLQCETTEPLASPAQIGRNPADGSFFAVDRYASAGRKVHHFDARLQRIEERDAAFESPWGIDSLSVRAPRVRIPPSGTSAAPRPMDRSTSS